MATYPGRPSRTAAGPGRLDLPYHRWPRAAGCVNWHTANPSSSFTFPFLPCLLPRPSPVQHVFRDPWLVWLCMAFASSGMHIATDRSHTRQSCAYGLGLVSMRNVHRRDGTWKRARRCCNTKNKAGSSKRTKYLVDLSRAGDLSHKSPGRRPRWVIRLPLCLSIQEEVREKADRGMKQAWQGTPPPKLERHRYVGRNVGV